ncbi:hypothetical protein D9615_010155 [Tricholomella constricta]|uniref:protein-tyrosine-phosphatase n=1 Tax=Tricholomella constricta TaxID=117010 RepID=A0A8H5GRK6_9AGAR|nr:hypothetical protein D9615_010155 [Tricholomella constricta]
MIFGHPSVNEIVQGQIYLGKCVPHSFYPKNPLGAKNPKHPSLPAALSAEVQKKLGTTHIVSVCPEYSSTGPNHLTVAVEDSEYENILIHLPNACQFIQTALDHGGRVFVHCAMGISRSATVVAAYLMKTRRMSRSAAMRFIKQKRPQVHPNYGFIKQLETFADCQYNPSPANPVYCKWKRQQKRNVTQFLNQMIDTTPIIPNELLLSSEFPDDSWQAESLILDSGITHLLSVSPAKIPHSASALLRKHRHVKIPEHRKDGLLLALPDVCDFIQDAIESGGQVLVHSSSESTACIVVCAFLMSARNLPSDDAVALIEDALPLFNPTKSFFRHLELFDACNYNPTAENQLVKRWGGASVVSHPTFTPASGIKASVEAIAIDIMSETGLDVKAFGEALSVIQRRNGRPL